MGAISTNDADREFVGNTPPKEFRGHLPLNLSNDGLVYAADRAADRIHVTDKQGKFVKEVRGARSSSSCRARSKRRMRDQGCEPVGTRTPVTDERSRCSKPQM
jgi:hypothetical protein